MAVVSSALLSSGSRGTLIRAADAFGAGVMLSAGCADPFGPKALRAGMGSTFRVPLPEFELRDAVALVADGGEPLSGLCRYGTLVLGSEREGLPDEVLEQCEGRVTGCERPCLAVYPFSGGGILYVPLTGDVEVDAILRAWAARGGLVAEYGAPEGRRAA